MFSPEEKGLPMLISANSRRASPIRLPPLVHVATKPDPVSNIKRRCGSPVALAVRRLMARLTDINKQQGALTASKQEASKEQQTLLTEGQRLANALRAMVKEHYGIRSEKLAEFGLQPFRGRTKAKPTPETPAPAPPPPVTPPAGSTAKPPAPASHSANPETV